MPLELYFVDCVTLMEQKARQAMMVWYWHLQPGPRHSPAEVWDEIDRVNLSR